MTRNVLTLCGLGAALMLTGCGSDSSTASSGSNPPPISTTPASGVEGIWRGSINTPVANDRLMQAVILGDGSFWLVYSNANDPTSTDPLLNAAGLMKGSATPNADGTVTVNNAVLLSLEDNTRTRADISGNFITGSTLNGTITLATAPVQVSLPSPAEFTSLYQLSYNNNLALAHLAGSYAGSLTTNLGKNGASMTVDASGAISGRTNPGCSFTGQAAQRERGNVFNVDITFDPVPACGTNSGAQVQGIMTLENGRAGVMAMDAGQTKSFIFVGNR